MYRRAFLKFIAGSPLVAAANPGFAQLAAGTTASQGDAVITNVQDALNVMDFEAAARKVLPPAHWGYMATGVDDDLTLQANRQAFSLYQLRARRLIDVTRIDMKTELLGQTLEVPIMISPVGRQRAFNPDGEAAVARAAKAKNTVQILSTASSLSVEEVTEAYGSPIWFQLYASSQWENTLKIVKRAEATGSPVLVWTVDILPGRNPETSTRFRRLDSRNCGSCHGPNFGGVAVGGSPAPITWTWLRRLKESTNMKIVIKGIETAEDAALCLDNGADGILVSNHGGRATDTGRGTLECLPEVVSAAGGKIPIIIDGGFRRGSDVFKALALGARAVCIGRPYIWGLSAFGQPGVERVLDILRAELQLVMRQCGTRSLQEITQNSVLPSPYRR